MEVCRDLQSTLARHEPYRTPHILGGLRARARWSPRDIPPPHARDLRELNELNFARFDAKVEQRFAQADARLEQRLAQVKTDLDQRITGVEVRLEQRIMGVEVKLEALKSELIKWMFLFWTGSALANLLIRR